MGHEMHDKIKLDIEIDNDRGRGLMCRVRAFNLMMATREQNGRWQQKNQRKKNNKTKQNRNKLTQLIH